MISIARDVKVLESRKKISTSDLTHKEDTVVIDMESDETKVIDNDDQLNDLPEVDVNNLEHDNNNTVSDMDDNESSYYESEVSIYQTDHGDMFDEDFMSKSLTQNVIDPDATIRRSMRQNIGNTSKYDDYVCKVEKADIKEPRTYDEAIQCVDSKQWKLAMDDEIKAIHQNNTWKLVDLPKDRKANGSKWVFKVKRDVNGKVLRYKARLVAQGFNQKYGTDYDEVFAPVVRPSTFRTLLSVAAKRKYHVKHYDIKTAFLNGKLDEEIYMKQPPTI